METPFVVAITKNFNMMCKSSFSQILRNVNLCKVALYIACLRRLMKCLSISIRRLTWFSRPIKVSMLFLWTFPTVRMIEISYVHVYTCPMVGICEYTYILGALASSTQEPKRDPSRPEGTARTPQATDSQTYATKRYTVTEYCATHYATWHKCCATWHRLCYVYVEILSVRANRT